MAWVIGFRKCVPSCILALILTLVPCFTFAASPKLEQQFEMAIQLYKAEKDAEAEKIFLDILESDPAQIRPRQFLGLMYARNGREEEALNMFEEIMEISPKHWGGPFGLGSVLMQQKKLPQAKSAFSQAATLSGNNPKVLFELAKINELLDLPGEASRVYNKIIEIGQANSRFVLMAESRLKEIGDRPETATAIAKHLKAADDLLAKKDLEGAIFQYEEAIKLIPLGIKLRFLLGTLAIRAGLGEKAEIILQEAIEIDPQYTPAHTALGNLYEIAGRTAKAIKHYEIVLKLAKGNEFELARKPLFSLLDAEEIAETLKEAKKFRAEGKLQEAEAAYQYAINISPETSIIQYNLALFYHETGRNFVAEKIIEIALTFEPDSKGLHLLLAGVYQEQRFFFKAMAEYIKVMSLSVKNPKSLLYRNAFSGVVQSAVLHAKAQTDAKEPLLAGLKKQQQGKIKEAIPFFLSAAVILPENPLLSYSIALVYQDINENRQAFLLLKKAVQINSGYYSAHLALARVAVKQNRFLTAISSYQRLLRLNNDILSQMELGRKLLHAEFIAAILKWQKTRESTRAIFNQGVAAAAAGKSQEAIRIFLSATEREPENLSLFFSLGVTYAASRQWGKAEQQFQHILSLQPDYPGALIRLATVQTLSEQLYIAKISYKKILKSQKKGSKDYQSTTRSLKEVNKKIKARKLSSRHEKRANLLYETDDPTKEMYEQTQWELEHALKLTPEKDQLHYAMGLVQKYFIFGNTGLTKTTAKQIWTRPEILDLPIQSFKKTISLNPNYLPAYVELGLLYRAMGKMKDEINIYKNALSLNRSTESDEFKKIQTGINTLQKRFSGSLGLNTRQDSNFTLSEPPRTDLSNTLSVNLSYLLIKNSRVKVPLSYTQTSTTYYRAQTFFSSHGLSLKLRHQIGFAFSYNLDSSYSVSFVEGVGLSSFRQGNSLSLRYKDGWFDLFSLNYRYSTLAFENNPNLDRTGQRAGFSLSERVFGFTTASLNYSFAIQNVPKAQDNTYKAHNASLLFQRRLPNNNLLRVSGSISQTDFQNIDTGGGKKRKNRLYSYGIGLTIPWAPRTSLTLDYLFQKNTSNLGVLVQQSDEELVQNVSNALGNYQKHLWTMGVRFVF